LEPACLDLVPLSKAAASGHHPGHPRLSFSQGVQALKIMEKTFELKVFISTRDSTCDECHENLGRKAWITLTKTGGALCLSCADLDHLIFLPSGNAALTRRSRKYSTLSAVVLKWTRARRHYERQGLLIESRALEQAEQEC